MGQEQLDSVYKDYSKDLGLDRETMYIKILDVCTHSLVTEELKGLKDGVARDIIQQLLLLIVPPTFETKENSNWGQHLTNKST